MGNSQPSPDESGPRSDLLLPALPAKVVMLCSPDYSTTWGKTGQAPPQLRDPYIRTRYRTYLGRSNSADLPKPRPHRLTSRCRGWLLLAVSPSSGLGFQLRTIERPSWPSCATGMACSFLKEELDQEVSGRPFTVEFSHHRTVAGSKARTRLYAPTKVRARPVRRTHHTHHPGTETRDGLPSHLSGAVNPGTLSLPSTCRSTGCSPLAEIRVLIWLPSSMGCRPTHPPPPIPAQPAQLHARLCSTQG